MTTKKFIGFSLISFGALDLFSPIALPWTQAYHQLLAGLPSSLVTQPTPTAGTNQAGAGLAATGLDALLIAVGVILVMA